jgi:PilZ domain
MALEHRWSRRQQVRLDAFVFHRFPGLVRVNILDIGLEGVFIGAEHLVLPPQVIVELSFALKISGKQTIHQLEAFVIHHTRDGYGLMFKDFRIAAFQALEGALYAA